MYSNETMGGMSICVNGKSEKFGQFVGLLSEDECEVGSAYCNGWIKIDNLEKVTLDNICNYCESNEDECGEYRECCFNIVKYGDLE